MAWINNIFSKYREKHLEQQNSDQEQQSLNELLIELDKDRFAKEGGRYDFNSIASVFAILARINNFIHCNNNVYKNKAGLKYVRTNLGFQAMTQYNHSIENLRLKNELDTFEVRIKQQSRKIQADTKMMAELMAQNEKLILKNSELQKENYQLKNPESRN